MKLANNNKITIIGPCGSGKSTLAIKLGEILHLPVYHIDCLYHKPNGATEDKDILLQKVKAIADTDKWIIDGLFKRSYELRFECAEAVIFLDFDEDFCIKSVTERQDENTHIGLPEYYEYKQSGLDRIVNVHIKGFAEIKKNIILPLCEKYPEKVIVFKNRKQVDTAVRALHNKM
jgi:adenylate kinase family enzyme